MNHTENSQAILGLTAEVISAHVKNNHVDAAALPLLIEQVYLALRHAGAAPAAPQAVGQAVGQAAGQTGNHNVAQTGVQAAPRSADAPPPAPAAALKKSVFPDYIICLEDGRKMKTLKRYLRSTYNMTPEQYREKWGLPPEYPMVAPSYAEHRSALAKKAGLGRKPAPAAAQPSPDQPQPAEPQPAEPEPAQRAAAPMPAAAAAAAMPEQPPAASAPPLIAEPPVHQGRTDHTLASVFSNFPRPVEDDAEVFEVQADGDERKPRRKPFSKQLARGMRR